MRRAQHLRAIADSHRMEDYDTFAMGRSMLRVASLALASSHFRQLGINLFEVGVELIEGALTGRTDVPLAFREVLPDLFPPVSSDC
jgi:hypothetical protein